MLRRLLARLRREHGFASVLLAMTLSSLLGMSALVVDVGHAFVARRQLQNAVDAASLAAAVYLPSTDPVVLANARAAAVAIAAANGVTISAGEVVFSTAATAYDVATVDAASSVSFVFAPALGVTFGAVGSHGVAQLGSVVGAAGVMPWGVEAPPGGFTFGEAYCLKLGSGGQNEECDEAEQGNFHALDVDNTGNSSANVYRDLIASGSATVVTVGETKDVVPGNMNGPTQQGTGCTGNDGRISGNTQEFEDVVEEHADGTYTVLDWSSPRLVIIAAVHFVDSDHAVVDGFTVFFITGCGNNGAVIGQFIDTVVPGGVWGAYVGGYGTRAVRLVG